MLISSMEEPVRHQRSVGERRGLPGGPPRPFFSTRSTRPQYPSARKSPRLSRSAKRAGARGQERNGNHPSGVAFQRVLLLSCSYTRCEWSIKDTDAMCRPSGDQSTRHRKCL